RRDFLSAMAAAGGVAAFGLPAFARADETSAKNAATVLASHAHDWDWLLGSWDVFHRRLKERMVGDTRWEEFAGQSAFWLAMGGLGNFDDNVLALPGGTYRGLSVRAFDPATSQWAIWWLDGRNPTVIEPPVRGGFHEGVGTFLGRDTFKGRPITMRFRWQDLHEPRPWWEQAFSADEGANWEVNWRNYFTRTSAKPIPLPRLTDAPGDFDFLVGSWKVKHRRLKQRLVGSNDWDEFGGTLVNQPVLGGHGNVGDNVMEFPAGTVRGIGLRAYDPATRQWLSWWLDGRSPANIASPVRGGFVDGVGTFIGDDDLNGRPIKTRVLWSRITPRSARWEQSCSADGGATWESNWISDFTRDG
ncbi:MAG: hypothetical protein ACREPX_11000, partial [Rhodanobacteraceae bacterium]